MLKIGEKRVWITGASSGIGEALAREFHRAGAKLILSARREEELKRVQADCGGESSARILPLDVSATAELGQKAQAALQIFGGIDILVNNAGVTQRSLVKDTELEVYRRLMEVNFFGAVALTKAVLPSMIENKNGHIMVISSLGENLVRRFAPATLRRNMRCMASSILCARRLRRTESG
jgi:NADP-dependent 3-hydroxy acid dehydrogenase YdfG